MEQGDRSGTRTARVQVHNLFFALWPDDASRLRMAEAADWLRETRTSPSGRWIRPARYHLTLRYLGAFDAVPPEVVERASAVAGAVRSDAFDLELDRIGSFGNRRIPAWLGCSAVPAPLGQLCRALDEGLRESGWVLPSALPVPHVTILHDAAAPIEAILPRPIPWPVRDFVLIDSPLDPPLPYRILGRWPLRAAICG